MSSFFLSKEKVALVLIKAKYQIFNESFATASELQQFTSFMQQEFNKRELGVIILYELDRENFHVNNGVITINERSWINLDIIPDKILNVLTDKSLILEFFSKIETRRLEILKSLSKSPIYAEVSTNKQLTCVKSNGKGV